MSEDQVTQEDKESALSKLSEMGTVLDLRSKWRELEISIKSPDGVRLKGKRILFYSWNQLKKLDAPHFNNAVLLKMKKGEEHEIPMDDGCTLYFRVTDYTGLLDATGNPTTKEL